MQTEVVANHAKLSLGKIGLNQLTKDLIKDLQKRFKKLCQQFNERELSIPDLKKKA